MGLFQEIIEDETSLRRLKRDGLKSPEAKRLIRLDEFQPSDKREYSGHWLAGRQEKWRSPQVFEKSLEHINKLAIDEAERRFKDDPLRGMQYVKDQIAFEDDPYKKPHGKFYLDRTYPNKKREAIPLGKSLKWFNHYYSFGGYGYWHSWKDVLEPYMSAGKSLDSKYDFVEDWQPEKPSSGTGSDKTNAAREKERREIERKPKYWIRRIHRRPGADYPYGVNESTYESFKEVSTDSAGRNIIARSIPYPNTANDISHEEWQDKFRERNAIERLIQEHEIEKEKKEIPQAGVAIQKGSYSNRGSSGQTSGAVNIKKILNRRPFHGGAHFVNTILTPLNNEEALGRKIS